MRGSVYWVAWVAVLVLVILITPGCNGLEWSEWTTCTATCGGGIRIKYRNVYQARDGVRVTQDDKDIPEPSMEIRACNTQSCDIAPTPQWSDWSEWSTCAVTCGSGQRMRYRQCKHDPMKLAYLHCPGSAVKVDICTKEEPCPTTATSTEEADIDALTEDERENIIIINETNAISGDNDTVSDNSTMVVENHLLVEIINQTNSQTDSLRDGEKKQEVIIIGAKEEELDIHKNKTSNSSSTDTRSNSGNATSEVDDSSQKHLVLVASKNTTSSMGKLNDASELTQTSTIQDVDTVQIDVKEKTTTTTENQTDTESVPKEDLSYQKEVIGQTSEVLDMSTDSKNKQTTTRAPTFEILIETKGNQINEVFSSNEITESVDDPSIVQEDENNPENGRNIHLKLGRDVDAHLSENVKNTEKGMVISEGENTDLETQVLEEIDVLGNDTSFGSKLGRTTNKHTRDVGDDDYYDADNVDEDDGDFDRYDDDFDNDDFDDNDAINDNVDGDDGDADDNGADGDADIGNVDDGDDAVDGDADGDIGNDDQLKDEDEDIVDNIDNFVSDTVDDNIDDDGHDHEDADANNDLDNGNNDEDTIDNIDNYISDPADEIYRLKRSLEGKNITGTWLLWQQWSPCSSSCSNGHQTRHRSCHGNGCHGDQQEVRLCVGQNKSCTQILVKYAEMERRLEVEGAESRRLFYEVLSGCVAIATVSVSVLGLIWWRLVRTRNARRQTIVYRFSDENLHLLQLQEES